VDWTFGTFLWAMVAAFFWFATIWMFISVFADIVRRDISGWAKAGWVILIIFLPFLGVLIYVIARPKLPDARLLGERERAATRQGRGYSPTDEIAEAARLHNQGTITAEEFERLKLRALTT
jgi:hypothetical protein